MSVTHTIERCAFLSHKTHSNSHTCSTPTEHLAESDQNAALRAKLEIAEQKCIRLEAENVSLRNTVYNSSNGVNTPGIFQTHFNARKTVFYR